MLLLATLAQRYRFELLDDAVTPRPVITLRVEDGMRMRLHARRAAEVPSGNAQHQ